LRDKTGADDGTKADLTLGIEAANRVLHQANAAVDRELRDEALQDLRARVDDWKSHRVDQFGDLLLHGHFPVVTGKSDVQKEVRTPSDIVRAAASIGNLRRIGSKYKGLVSNYRHSDSLLPHRQKDTTASQWTLLPARKSQDIATPRPLSIFSEEDYFLGNMIFHHFDGIHPLTGSPF
jgi:cell division control protein 24